MSMRQRKRHVVSPKPRSSHEGIENRARLKVDASGRVLIPADMRAAMGLKGGGPVLAWLDQGELHLVGIEVAARHAQQIFRSRVGRNVNLADELIADRRAEARREGKNA